MSQKIELDPAMFQQVVEFYKASLAGVMANPITFNKEFQNQLQGRGQSSEDIALITAITAVKKLAALQKMMNDPEPEKPKLVIV